MWCREALRNGTAYDGWMPTGRFSQAQCAPWRQEMRYVPRRGSCRWTQTPWRVSLASNPLVWKHQRVPEPLPTAKPTPRDRCAAHGAPWGPDDGGRPHRAWLDDPCMAALSRLRSIPGSMACYCVPMLALGCVSSRQLRDTTQESPLHIRHIDRYKTWHTDGRLGESWPIVAQHFCGCDHPRKRQ